VGSWFLCAPSACILITTVVLSQYVDYPCWLSKWGFCRSYAEWAAGWKYSSGAEVLGGFVAPRPDIEAV
jgi:hypothetical protein